MSRTIMHTLVASTAMALALPTVSFAQEAQADEPAAAPEENAIIVTARRESENLQDVPVSVQVVTGDSLKKLAITSVEEVSKLAPGLTLVNAGSSTSITLRGVTWQPGSGTPATPIYLNEAPFDPGNTIVSLFDVGQIEVLRGPQGTSRGAPSISGAVTISTRRPDLEEFGGSLLALYGEGDHFDVQAAVNAPIIKDVLAIRLAANIENSDANRVNSVNSTIKPHFRDRSYRATVLFKPTDNFSLQAMYQQRKTNTREYTQVVGSGSPGFATFGIPANYNGPAVSLDDRASVQDQPSYRPQHVDLLTVNAQWEVFNHTISANYGRQFNRSPAVLNATDTVNAIKGFETFTSPSFASLPKFETREIRISSQRSPDRPFDYDIGWFSKSSDGVTLFSLPTYTPGAFGAPYGPSGFPGVTTTPRPGYLVNTTLATQILQKFDSFYGNVRFHLDSDTELSGGLAIIRDRVLTDTNITSTAGLIALPRFTGSCVVRAGGQVVFTFPNSADYGPGYCQIVNPASSSRQLDNTKYTKALYNFSLSHRFSDAVLAYATTGSSYRSGLASIGNAGLRPDLVVPKPETAKSYEIGIKTNPTSWARVNISAFQLDYKDQLTSLIGVKYYNPFLSAASNPVSSNVSFYGNVDARVRGVEAEISLRPVDQFTLNANVSYSRITSKGGSIPCTNPAVPLSATNVINFCPVTEGQVLNSQSPFQATVNGSYDVPITDSFGGYLRFNVAYKGNNPNFGNFRAADGTFREVGSYAIVDLFAGLASSEAGWDLGVYAKNVFDKQVELTRNSPASVYAILSAVAPAGYDEVRTTLPREVGVALRFSFGSR